MDRRRCVLVLPRCYLQLFDFGEVRIAGSQCQAVLEGNGRAPDIVFRQRPALEAQCILRLSVASRRLGVASQHHVARCEFVYARRIFHSARRLTGAVA